MNPDIAFKVMSQCLHKSLDYWDVNGWEVNISATVFDEDEPGSGLCQISENYMRASISVDLERVENLEELWQVVAHEVCHIVSAEYRVFHKAVPTDDFTDAIWDMACERTTTQLERVFLREHPYPGDKEFKA